MEPGRKEGSLSPSPASEGIYATLRSGPSHEGYVRRDTRRLRIRCHLTARRALSGVGTFPASPAAQPGRPPSIPRAGLKDRPGCDLREGGAALGWGTRAKKRPLSPAAEPGRPGYRSLRPRPCGHAVWSRVLSPVQDGARGTRLSSAVPKRTEPLRRGGASPEARSTSSHSAPAWKFVPRTPHWRCLALARHSPRRATLQRSGLLISVPPVCPPIGSRPGIRQ